MPKIQGNASMGPRPNGRGDAHFCQRPSWETELQWGHAQTGVETRPSPIPPSAERCSFNGATPKRAWRPGETRPSHSPTRSLQWGHAQTGVETAPL